MISKIHKARRYAEERERFSFSSFSINFKGTNNDHVISFQDDNFTCDCEFFTHRGCCAHTMALERLLDHMVLE